MYLTIRNRLRDALAAFIHKTYGVEISVVLEKPPKLEMGEAASPVCFELAKRLKKAPRAIAQEIAAGLPKLEGIDRVAVAGGGYLNAFFDRATLWNEVQAEPSGKWIGTLPQHKKVIVEHTSINPNKAAHIGHLRNAVLGDTMVRLLQQAGHEVVVQNYIDNTGVQVADVVIAFQHMEKKSLGEVRKLAAEPHFDYLCWDLYAKATQFFEEDKVRVGKLRGETLKAIEAGTSETAEMAAVIGDTIVGYHLRTMARLGIYYELLARESEILHLHFWDAAFEKLKASGAIQFATTGKNAGCWIMPWGKETKEVKEVNELKESDPETQSPTSTSEEDDQAKIIVRSNGTVTYVGKDIAYQLWKFGLLGKDFHYRIGRIPHRDTPSGSPRPGLATVGLPALAEQQSSITSLIRASPIYRTWSQRPCELSAIPGKPITPTISITRSSRSHRVALRRWATKLQPRKRSRTWKSAGARVWA